MGNVEFNPMDPDFIEDPSPPYPLLGPEAPSPHTPLGLWVRPRSDEVVAARRDPRLTKEPIAAFVAARTGAPAPAGGLSMLDRDPPDHTRLRGLVNKAFTPRVVEKLRPDIQDIVDSLLAKAHDTHSMDLMEDFAFPIPVIVICQMLGVPV